jgi:hypothetical protein
LYDPDSRVKAERSAMFIMRGVYSSARYTEKGLAVNLDTQHGMFFPDGGLFKQ